jgi:DNA-binding transcriptional regulator GbsR (MarR family)
LKLAVAKAAKQTLGKLKQRPRKPWISENTSLIEQRRKHQIDKNKSQYNRIRNRINRQSKRDKEEWLENTVYTMTLGTSSALTSWLRYV